MSATGGVLRNSVYLVVAGGAERAGSLVVALILSRMEGAEGLGVYVTVIAYFQLLTVAAELGVSNYLVREIAKDVERTATWIAHAVVVATTTSVLFTGAVLVLVPHIGLDRQVRAGMSVVVIGVLPAALNVVTRAVFVAHQRVGFDAGANVAASVFLVVSGWLMLRAGIGVIGLIAAYVVTRLLITIFSLVVIHRVVARLHPEFDRAFAVDMLRGLRPFAGSTVVGALFARPEVLLLSLMASPAQVGYFGAAFKTVDLWQLIPETYLMNAYPLLTRGHEEDPSFAADMQRRVTTILLALGLPISVGLAVAAEPIIALLYGPDFGGAVPLLRILAVLGVLFCIHTVLWRSLSARGDQSAVLRIQIPTLGLRLLVGVALIAQFGAIGAAITIPILLSIHNGFLARALRRGGEPVVDIRQVWPYGAAALLMGGAIAASGADSLIVAVVVGVPVYVGAAVLLLRLAVPEARPVLSFSLPERERT